MNPLWNRYQALKAEQPRLRMRDAATALQVSEAELVASDPATTPLQPAWADQLGALIALGPVMALTRNEAAVHEKTGLYDNVQIEGGMGLALNPDIDLRFFLTRWAHGFAVAGERPSLQWFDAQGVAVHKVFLTDQSDRAAYDALVARFAAGAAGSGQVVTTPRAVPAVPLSDDEVDVVAFRSEWLALQDTHDFFSLIRRHKLTRIQALRLAPRDHTREVGVAAVDALLDQAAASGLSIMVFVNNPGCVQIHTGPVKRIVRMDDWLNVMDPGFNLHLRMPLFAQAWIVRKPTCDGIVTSLECFDAHGELVMQCFGERKPGIPELADWTRLAATLMDIEPGAPRNEAAHA